MLVDPGILVEHSGDDADFLAIDRLSTLRNVGLQQCRDEYGLITQRALRCADAEQPVPVVAFALDNGEFVNREPTLA